ncbi:MAG: ABC transporter ATP-binding protein [Candidatus Marinimicrobia bacterium]|nr:ABC transporter ATP-binding protein [Candidatus Neomarinimicrobiota bacterium]
MLEAHNISKTYYKTEEAIPVLNELNISIEKGEILVLMGPSGSGKSTLLNILGTLDSDYSGNLIIDELPITKAVDLGNIRRHKLGFIFQFHHLLPEFTILENLLIPQMIATNCSDIPKKVAIDMLEIIGLKDRMNHYPNEISGGERQRVAVLRAMVNNPCLILADEPTGNLDRENSQIMLKLMAELKEKYQQSFIIATHDQSILDIADRVLYLKDGKIKKEI